MAYLPFYDMVDMLYYRVLKKSEERKETKRRNKKFSGVVLLLLKGKLFFLINRYDYYQFQIRTHKSIASINDRLHFKRR